MRCLSCVQDLAYIRLLWQSCWMRVILDRVIGTGTRYLTTRKLEKDYSEVKMSIMASQISGVSIVYSTVCSGEDQRKHQSSASLASSAENVSIWWHHHDKSNYLNVLQHTRTQYAVFFKMCQKFIVHDEVTVQEDGMIFISLSEILARHFTASRRGWSCGTNKHMHG